MARLSLMRPSSKDPKLTFEYPEDKGGAVRIVYGNIVNGNILFILTSWWGHRKR